MLTGVVPSRHGVTWNGHIEDACLVCRPSSSLDGALVTRRRSQWVILLTADHGGTGTEHPRDDPLSQLVRWIASGPSVREGFDLAAVKGLTVDTTATFFTACALLGIDVPYVIDGKRVLEILDTSATRR